jgi:2-methylisocitrate lyase-like PEP mutase family enzyme
MKEASAAWIERGAAFRALHHRDRPFIVPNPWDVGTARLLQSLGFEALATTSAGFAFSLGRPDGAGLLSRDETIAHAAQIAAAVGIPVTADLENGFGDRPEDVHRTVLQAGEAGLAGGSIEDATGRPDAPVYDHGLAVDRVAAAAEAARSLPVPFTLTARAENFLMGHPDLDDTIRRLQDYGKAGADVLYAPALPDLDAIALVCSSVGKPVNVVVGLAGNFAPVAALASAGVRRISVGSSLARTALGGFLKAAREMREQGTFEQLREAEPFAALQKLMAEGLSR